MKKVIKKNVKKHKSTDSDIGDLSDFSDFSEIWSEEESIEEIECLQMAPQDIEHRILCKTAAEYFTLPNVLPTHIPHKKLSIKFEQQQLKPEPLQNFTKNQENRKKRYLSETKFPLFSRSGSDVKKGNIRFGVDSQKKLIVVDQLKIINHVKTKPDVGFLYMVYSAPRWSEHYGPYCLKVVPFKKIKIERFLTISPQGVTQYFPGEMNFTPLDQWEREYLQYCKIINMKTFSLFRIWKSFFTWRKFVTRKKFKTAQKYLNKYLFILQPILKYALISIQKEYLDVLSQTYIDRCIIENNALFDWNEFQMGQLELMEQNVYNFHSVVLEITYKSCLDALARVGFVPNDDNFLPRDMKMPVGVTVLFGKTKMTYTQQANKRRFCLRLSNFIHLVDYKMITMMHILLRNSYEDLDDLLKMHYQFIPDFEICTNDDIKEVLEKYRPEDSPQAPLFIVDLLCDYDNSDNNEIILDPTEQIYFEAFLQLLTLWEDKLTIIEIFLKNTKLDIFTEPMINGKQDERVPIRGPILQEFLDSDPKIFILKNDIYKILHTNLIHVKTYGHRFHYVSEFLDRNALIHHEKIIKETNLRVFRAWLIEFNEQIERIDLIPNSQNMGVFLVQMERFKEFSLPYTYVLLEVIYDVLPEIGKNKINDLSSEATNAVAFLEFEPSDTLGFVDYLSFLDKCQKTLDTMDNESDYCKEVYDLVEEFQIPCPDEDILNYLNFSVILTSFRNTVDLLLADRGRLIELFNGFLNKDISELILQVGNIGFEASQPWLIDIESDVAEVKEVLQRYNEELEECVEKVNQIKAYQKQFRIEVTRFEMVEDVIEDIKLRILLWDSLSNWDNLVNEWFIKDFKDLDPEDINNVTTKYVKFVFQLEKGLPQNEIVPLLKEKVEDMKNKLPVIYNLHNPAFKARHWLMIEDILNYKFQKDEILTLKLLDEIKAFEHPDELQEISAQASSEQGLELLLKKVEELWLSLEFMVIPYRDFKDVFILAGLDEMQQNIEDTNINLSTIISSRHVGPIKPRVEDWIEKMKLFVTTLDEWVECQQFWIYLEQIFTAPDIQRQLPTEAKLFTMVDKSFKEIMRVTQKTPLAMPTCTKPGMLETFQNNNKMLDQIMKCLEAYLETKRVAFPRFYFLSNDELIEILAQTRNPHAVQPHLRKCFDAIAKLEFGVKSLAGGEVTSTMKLSEVIFTTDIMAMLSPEGERVELTKGLKARGNVEDWLGKVEEAMILSLSRKMKISYYDYFQTPKTKWIFEHPSQIILTINQVMWAGKVHEIMKSSSPVQGLHDFEKFSFKDLNTLAALVRGELDSIGRLIMSNLITIAVHARDIITGMCKLQVSSMNDFEWLKQLRYYWMEQSEIIEARMSSATYDYKYEYLGALTRLVITPLTDRCYLCLMGALQLDLGGSPAGPAGTGKTETTKDLAKSLAVLCVVFNCSEGLDYKIMGRFFAGLAQCGAWCCFDEFNRIDIEVLSVIAQQLITIRNAKAAKLKRFMFEGREIKLLPTCATFITMNPGYAGRTELPDNLKALFRPMAMMVPDYALIAEVILYSEGFESSKGLANKMVQMYKLCSEQLSQQDHYDFGMRAVKSVLVMAGSLKRQNPDKSEDVVLIRALKDSNVPKFLADDVELFQGIINDLFPGVVIPEQDYGVFQEAIITIMKKSNLQPEPPMIIKVIQLYETMIVRHGVMLVGPTGGGKSTVLNILKETLTKLEEDGVENRYYKNVVTYIINPKSVTIGELYGEVNPLTLEWHDGLLGIMVRKTGQSLNEDHQWVVCDGPVDAVWIENMNTVLDDNKMLCLANSERIKLTPYVHMIFEVEDLSQASPATVSRCGMVYIDPNDIKFMPYVISWLNKLKISFLNEEYKEYIESLFERYVAVILYFIKKNCEIAIKQVDIGKVSMLCALYESLLIDPEAFDKSLDRNRMRTLLCQSFAFCSIWCLGGNIIEKDRDTIDIYVRDLFEADQDAHIPSALGELWNLWVNFSQKKMEVWLKLIPKYTYDPMTPFFEMLVPTIDTVRFGYLMRQFMKINKPLLFTGLTGVGKTVIVKSVLKNLLQEGEYVSIMVNFSAQTSSGRTQEIIEAKLERKSKTLLGAPIGKRAIIFVDDVNMPKQDKYGSQPPIELLRQYLDYGGFYDRDKLFWVTIKDVILMAACAPPGGGRNPITPRFIRHFGMLLIPKPTEVALKVIFRAILSGFLKEFADPVKAIGDKIVNAAVEVYSRIALELLPTPTKSHYVFNLRDLSKCIQGILQADSGVVIDTPDILKLFYHESLRVFHDRLINFEDKSYFYLLMKDVCMRCFNVPIFELEVSNNLVKNPPILLYGDFIQIGAAKENRIYEEIVNIQKLKNVLQDYLDDFNLVSSVQLKLIFFMDAIEHMCRIARILRSERGNALLVGVGGMGKRSLTMLASHVNAYRCMQIELTRNYDHTSFFEDIRKFYYEAGVLAHDTVFLFSDTQIVLEEFLEDINNMLNTGEVPNLYDSEELEKVIIGTRPAAKKVGIAENARDHIFEFFISRVRSKLHVVLCMSPVGDAFRGRCRMFPSLVNCCTIDWFSEWPEEALLSVATDCFKDIPDELLQQNLSKICVIIHESVTSMTYRFYAEVRRRYYTTPSSYLELLKLYTSLLQTQRDKVSKKKTRIENGLRKLLETNELVEKMKIELTEMGPKLIEKSADTEKLLEFLSKETNRADKVRGIVKADEVQAKRKAAETQELADDAQRDLDAAMPLLDQALIALASLNKTDINELRVFVKPPRLVQFVMEAVCVLLNKKPDWATAKQVMADTNFLKYLQEYEKDKITNKMLEKLKLYVDDPDFVPDKVAKQSKVCMSMCKWVIAIDAYAKVYRIVEPKKLRLKEAEVELQQVMSLLKEKQQMLADVEHEIAQLEATFEASMAEKNFLEYSMELCSARLGRSGRLISALGDEQGRWVETIKQLSGELNNMLGDILLASGFIAYLGAFTDFYREILIKHWLKNVLELQIPATSNFNLIQILADPYDVSMWNVFGLPRDSVSTENAIMVTRGLRWPLMIDPQEQANRWIRQMEAKNSLKIIKLADPNYMRVLESAIRVGMPVLMEDLGEQVDPALAPILNKQTYIVAGRLLIRLGDTEVDYDPNFKFYMTSKMSNPHYLPEVCIMVTIVNFTVTPSGLEDQLLADVVRLERPDLEKQRNELVLKINTDKAQLQAIEDKILRKLFSSEGNILDDEELIETLTESKETSAIIATRLVDSEATEELISIAREKYRTVANRGSCLFFVVANLAEIDPMYQYSLKYFTQVFDTVIETSAKSIDLDVRLATLIKEITLAIYVNVSRGLFERHKLVYSFMLCCSIYKNIGKITDAQFKFLLRGPGGAKMNLPKAPDIPHLTENIWLCLNFLKHTFRGFEDIVQNIDHKIKISIGDFHQDLTLDPKATKEYNLNEKLKDFDKLMILKVLREEKLLFALTEYVKINMGKTFVESPQVSLNLLFKDISKMVPLIFILSTGSDPFRSFQRFASEMGLEKNYQSISLGQGQGPVAERMINQALISGDWVFLQNCHLATSWMPYMEQMLKDLGNEPDNIHPKFRLFLSSMPEKRFPVSVLQNSVKVTNEPPKGLRANVKRAFAELNKQFFEENILGPKWRKMIFGICFFHAVIQERKKFGPLGWNIVYEFNDSDRECALNTIKMFCEDGTISWDALEYVTSQITYGGRVTDYWDQRCLSSVLSGFFSPKILNPGYTYSKSGVYYCPESETIFKLNDYKKFIENLPIIELPEIFGMHENANIAFQKKETQDVINTILGIQPQESASSEGKSSDEIVYEIAQSILDSVTFFIDSDEALPALTKRDECDRLPSLSTVLFHEIDRFNKMFRVLENSLDSLQKAIKGFVVMSEALEEVYNSFLNNTVPIMWSQVGYLSLKPLGSWIKDLIVRIDFIQNWLARGSPISFWISGFFFPQGFLTGVLQSHSRKYNFPIDELKFDFEVKNKIINQEEIMESRKGQNKNVDELFSGLSVPHDGVLIHGLFLDAARWDMNKMILADAFAGEINPPLPAIHFLPINQLHYNEGSRYVTPLYKTGERAGVLSTTGHSTNFVLSILLPTNIDPNQWILRGTALLTQTSQ